MNTIHNRFVDMPDGGTRWEMLAKFEFQGFPWKYISFIFRGSIRNRLREDMLNFREFVEQSEGVPPLPEEEPEDEHDEMDESEDDDHNDGDEEKPE